MVRNDNTNAIVNTNDVIRSDQIRNLRVTVKIGRNKLAEN